MEWSYEIQNTHITEEIPPLFSFMLSDPVDNEALWLGGIYNAKGAIVSFNTEVVNAMAYIRFDRMDEI